MELNKITADLSFLGSSIQQIKITNNIINLPSEAKIKFGIDTEIKNIVKDEDSLNVRGYLALKIIIDVKVARTPYKSKFMLELEGCFQSVEMDEEAFVERLYINGGSALYAIARGIILTLSSDTYKSGKILLPMVNMVQFFSEEKIPKLQKQIAEENK